jgi:hypothetical protein
MIAWFKSDDCSKALSPQTAPWALPGAHTGWA